MEVIEAIKQRRSIVNFAERPIADDILRQIVEAGYLAPTGGNFPSRELLVTSDREILAHLGQAHAHCKWIAGAAAAVVLIGKPAQSRYWVEDCSVVGAQVWLAAVSLGLGGAWAAMYQSDNEAESFRREAHCRERLNIPTELRVVGVIALGYPAAVPAAKAKPAFSAVVHWGTYGQHAP